MTELEEAPSTEITTQEEDNSSLEAPEQESVEKTQSDSGQSTEVVAETEEPVFEGTGSYQG